MLRRNSSFTQKSYSGSENVYAKTVFTQKFSVYAITYQYAEYAIYAKILKQYAKILKFTQ